MMLLCRRSQQRRLGVHDINVVRQQHQGEFSHVLEELRRDEIRFCPGMQRTIQISKYEYYQSRGYGSLRG